MWEVVAVDQRSWEVFAPISRARGLSSPRVMLSTIPSSYMSALIAPPNSNFVFLRAFALVLRRQSDIGDAWFWIRAAEDEAWVAAPGSFGVIIPAGRPCTATRAVKCIMTAVISIRYICNEELSRRCRIACLFMPSALPEHGLKLKWSDAQLTSTRGIGFVAASQLDRPHSALSSECFLPLEHIARSR